MPGKSQIADRIAARGTSRGAAAAAVDAVLDEITAALAAGERVTLTGFGTFEAAGRPARTARNPRTGESLDVAATTVARFHPGATLRARVAAGPGEPLGGVADLSAVQGVVRPAASPAAPSTAPAAQSPSDGKAAKPRSKAKAEPKPKAKAEPKPKAKTEPKSKAKSDAKAKSKAKAKKSSGSGKGRAKKK